MSQASSLLPPDHAADAEAAVVCAAFFDLSLIASLDLRPADFYQLPERTVLETLVALRDQGLTEAPVETVVDHLRRRGRLADVGGTGALARLLDTTPSCSDLAPLARSIRESAQVRRVESTLAQCRLDCRSGVGDRQELLARVRRAVELATEGGTLARGLPVVDVAEVPKDKPPTPFVCERLHLAPGRPAALVGYAGAGKTLLAADLALAVAAPEDSGVTFWGGLVPDRRGKVLLLDFEVGRDLTERRLLRLAAGRWGQLSDWAGRLAFSSFPRWSLVSRGAEEQLIETLREHTLCVIDSLTAITPGVDENARGMADAMALLTRVSEASGCAILILHHEGKPGQDGPRAAHLRARGHSSIQGIWSSQWAVTSLGEGRLKIEHGKSQFEGGARPDVHCQICDVHDGEGQRVGVRLAPVGPVEGQEPGSPAPVPAGALARVKAQVVAALEAMPAGLSSKELHEEVKRRGGSATDTRYKAVDDLLKEGTVVVGREGKRLVYRLKETITSLTGNRSGNDGEEDGHGVRLPLDYLPGR